MPRTRKVSSEEEFRKTRPATSSEARETYLTNLALDLAEQQLRDGTAKSQVITHFLKLATEREKTERELLLLQKELVKAKTDALEAAARNEEMFKEAIKAMGVYSGETDEDGEYNEDGYEY